jgi:hypothetical protein
MDFRPGLLTDSATLEAKSMATTMASPFGGDKSLTILSRLLLSNHVSQGASADTHGQPNQDMAMGEINRQEFADMLALAHSHHVVMRAMEILAQLRDGAQNPSLAEWAAGAIEHERARIENALSFLETICGALESDGCDVTVIKSLDHWPDLGSDLDLYTNAQPASVIRFMKRHFNARIAARSWGDRLANKWNFIVPGLPELVEVHMGRLGQTGEQVAMANRLRARARTVKIGEQVFRVPSAEDRLMICTLQRMYRHFYFRLCDMVDTARLLETRTVDYDDLRSSAEASAIWEGVATYLCIVSDYVRCYRGRSLDLPLFVRLSARFGGDQLRFKRGFLRLPILPNSARLYAAQLTGLMRKGDLRNSVRLSLLPCLAAAAALGQKITGSDKGIW